MLFFNYCKNIVNLQKCYIVCFITHLQKDESSEKVYEVLYENGV
jgi:hypothetical protein